MLPLKVFSKGGCLPRNPNPAAAASCGPWSLGTQPPSSCCGRSTRRCTRSCRQAGQAGSQPARHPGQKSALKAERRKRGCERDEGQSSASLPWTSRCLRGQDAASAPSPAATQPCCHPALVLSVCACLHTPLQAQAYERRLFTADQEAPPSQLREGRTLLQVRPPASPACLSACRLLACLPGCLWGAAQQHIAHTSGQPWWLQHGYASQTCR